MIKTGLALSLLIACCVSQPLTAKEQPTLNDPTRPLINTQYKPQKSSTSETDKKPVQQKNQLKGIIVQNKSNRAIIDSSIVTVGDPINGYIVHAIDAHKVLLRKGKQYKTLRLTPSVKAVNK